MQTCGSLTGARRSANGFKRKSCTGCATD